MNIKQNVPLAQYTSFGVGGNAKKLIQIDSTSEIEQLTDEIDRPLWLLGYGTNVLISDEGLPGTTLLLRNNDIEVEGERITVGAGAWWDDVVLAAIVNNLWGIELMSAIPGGVGGSTFINITAYGQSLSDRLEWVETFDVSTRELQRWNAQDLQWAYKQSVFQEPRFASHIITQVGLRLSRAPTTDVTYQSALDVATELRITPDSLLGRRQIILEARKRAGSLFAYDGPSEKTVGSFFRNPLVPAELIDHIISFDESGKTKEQITTMNKTHGGSEQRVSAAHVMLAAGFHRGQTWGNVRLHPKNLLKIENTGNATASDIYTVAQEIISSVKEQFNITLEPEARILGNF